MYHFFRSRLSYEQFSAFLANIKELNAQKQTREVNIYWAEVLDSKIVSKQLIIVSIGWFVLF